MQDALDRCLAKDPEGDDKPGSALLFAMLLDKGAPVECVRIAAPPSHKSEPPGKSPRFRLFFRPRYSPDLNPIEQFFAKLKHWLRKAAGRTADALYEAIGPILNRVTSHECANYFANAGYAPA